MLKNVQESVVITGLGAYEPAKVVSNYDLEKIVDTSDEWIVSRTGIRERRIASSQETTSFMGKRAAERALSRAGLVAKDINLLIVGTITPDMPFPATACHIQSAMGMRGNIAFDVNAACSGFLHILEIAHKLLLGNKDHKHALVIGAEKMSSVINWEDRSTCVLFADGAGAAVLSKKEGQEVHGIKVIDTLLGADGASAELLYMPGGGCLHPHSQAAENPEKYFLKMNGKGTFKNAVKCMEQAARGLLTKCNCRLEDIDYVIPHQANIRIIEALSSRLQIPMDHFVSTIAKHGNTSAASIPLAFNDAWEKNRLKPNSKILLLAFGAGLTWGATLLEWT